MQFFFFAFTRFRLFAGCSHTAAIMGLTPKQKEDLNKAIVEYLLISGHKDCAKAVAEETGAEIQSSLPRAGILERKWTSVVRLSKKNLELEAEVQRLSEQLASAPKPRAKITTLGLPSPPSKTTMTGHRFALTSVDIHPVFPMIATAAEGSEIKIWDGDTGELERTLKSHMNTVNGLAFSPQGSVLASCSTDLTVKLWSTETFDNFKTLRGHSHTISAVAFSPSGDYILSASRDGTVRIWDISTGQCPKTLYHPQTPETVWIRALDIMSLAQEQESADSSVIVATAGSDHHARIWEGSVSTLSSQPIILAGHSHVIEDICLSPKTSCAFMQAAQEANQKGGQAAMLQLAANTTSENDLKLFNSSEATSGTYVATASRDKTIKVWHVPSKECVFTLKGHDNWVRALAWHPCGRYLISSSDDRTIRCWDLLAGGKMIRVIRDAHNHFISGMALDKKATLLATVGVDKEVRLWECK